MSIRTFPPATSFSANISCGVCQKRLTPANAAVGPYDAAGAIIYVCNQHLKDGLRFIVMLADYTAEERGKRPTNQKAAMLLAEKVVCDARFVY